MAGQFSDVFLTHSPAKTGPWSVEGGPVGWMESLGRRMTGALESSLSLATIRPPAFALATGGPGGRGGGITVNVYAGVGDPVAIGRQVSEALRAYNRASGTEASGP
jgi:hypothetical protein